MRRGLSAVAELLVLSDHTLDLALLVAEFPTKRSTHHFCYLKSRYHHRQLHQINKFDVSFIVRRLLIG